MDWLAREHPGDVRQVQNYCRHSRELLPELLAAVRRRLRDTGAALVVHAGDLVEGLCGSAELARKQCADAVAFLDQAQLGVPFLLTRGNHETAGPGAVEAYREVVLPYLGRQVGTPLTAPRYYVERHGCLFVLYDGYDQDALPWLRQVLEAQPARHVFVVVHQPVVPFQTRANWSLLIRRLLEAETPTIRYFEYAQTAGFALFQVEGDAVKAEVYTGARDRPWRRLDLTALLHG